MLIVHDLDTNGGVDFEDGPMWCVWQFHIVEPQVHDLLFQWAALRRRLPLGI